jgi:hypothetical protein
VTCEPVEEADDPRFFCGRISVEAEELDGPIDDQLTVYGETPAEAIEAAASIWVTTFFVPFHELVHDTDGGEAWDELTTGPSDAPLSWHVFATWKHPSTMGTGGTKACFSVLAELLAERLLDRRTHALKCALIKAEGVEHEPGEKRFAVCHFDGENWQEGAEALLDLMHDWGDIPHSRAVRVWFFFRPVTS